MKKNLKLILGIVTAVLIFSLLTILSVRHKQAEPVPDGTVGNTAGNVNNGGYFCEYDGTVYFSNPYDGGSLYSMSPDESGMQKLVSAKVSHINAGGDYLFYYQEEASGASGLGYVRRSHGIYRCLLDGGDITCLSKDLLFNAQLIGNHLYYLSSSDQGAEFYRLQADSGEQELLANTGWNFACAMPDGTVYYNGTESDHHLFRYDTRTGTSSTVWEGNLWYPVYDDGYIYYLDVSSNYRLCRYSLSGDTVEILTHDRVDCFNLTGSYIFYQKNSADAPALMRMTLDGQNTETVMQGNFTHISVTSRYVYFSAFDSDMPVYRTPVEGDIQVSTFSAALEAASANVEQ